MNNEYKRNLVLVNTITGIRVIGALLLFPIYYLFGSFYAGLVTIFFLLTDWIDGFLARKLNVSTFFGAIFDSMSDKLFNIVALVILCFMNNIMIIPIIMELFILLIGYNEAFMGSNVASSKIGKIKTLLLDITLILNFVVFGFTDFCNIFNFTINFYGLELVTNIITYIAIIFETITLINYILKSVFSKNKKYIYSSKKKLISRDKRWQLVFDHDFYLKHKDDDIRNFIYIN